MHSGRTVLVISLVILAPFEAFAGTATQTDWSGNDGIYGPVVDWGNEYYYADIDMSCSNPSDLILLPLEHTVDGAFDYAQSVYSADVNGDGYMDVLGAACAADVITWWENVDGTGTSWREHTVDGSYNRAMSVYSADVNGDGYMDVLGAAQSADDITWWDLTGFLPDGSLESSVLDIQESPDWQTIDWTCTEPAGTGVALQVRASDNSSNMGEWSDTLTAPCTLEGILTDEDLYFQYRAILTTTDSLSTPVLQDVTVVWLPYIGTEEAEGASFVLHGARPNPVLGTAVLVFTLFVDSWTELTVYDLTGRVLYSINGEYRTGVHELILDGLASGVYLIRMTSNEFTDTRQFVLIN
ncbi:MAG: T9SS type A sorting domain-containing protein [Candidatus Aegiribacteria sp.]|nr:T9SS type A sorting domain-containing protein [Candidatus Aegiribacteria sp.]